MPTLLNFGLEFSMGLLVSVLLARWFIWPFLRTRTFSTALLILLAPFLIRYMGLMTLVPGVVDPAVTRSSFAFYQAWGDFGSFLLALLAMALVHRRHPLALAAVWTFNVFGTVDFLQAVLRGAVGGGGGGSLGAFWYIPVAYVPFGMVVHALIRRNWHNQGNRAPAGRTSLDSDHNGRGADGSARRSHAGNSPHGATLWAAETVAGNNATHTAGPATLAPGILAWDAPEFGGRALRIVLIVLLVRFAPKPIVTWQGIRSEVFRPQVDINVFCLEVTLTLVFEYYFAILGHRAHQ